MNDAVHVEYIPDGCTSIPVWTGFRELRFGGLRLDFVVRGRTVAIRRQEPERAQDAPIGNRTTPECCERVRHIIERSKQLKVLQLKIDDVRPNFGLGPDRVEEALPQARPGTHPR
jgi:hypothetical protein